MLHITRVCYYAVTDSTRQLETLINFEQLLAVYTATACEMLSSLLTTAYTVNISSLVNKCHETNINPFSHTRTIECKRNLLSGIKLTQENRSVRQNHIHGLLQHLSQNQYQVEHLVGLTSH